MRELLPLFLCFLILIAQAEEKKPDAKPHSLKLLCIGDSITQGDAYTTSWRYDLWKRLIDSNVKVDMVGTVTTNFEGDPEFPDHKGQQFDNEHEGRWGWTAGKVAETLPLVLKKVDADVALIHLGSNDFLLGKGPRPVLEAHEAIIAALRADNPKIKIFVAQLIPNGAPRALPAFNKALPAAAKEWSTEQSPVYVVDMVTDFKLDDMTYDQLHPEENGEAFMATRWFEALQKAKVVPAKN